MVQLDAICCQYRSQMEFAYPAELVQYALSIRHMIGLQHIESLDRIFRGSYKTETQYQNNQTKYRMKLSILIFNFVVVANSTSHNTR